MVEFDKYFENGKGTLINILLDMFRGICSVLLSILFTHEIKLHDNILNLFVCQFFPNEAHGASSTETYTFHDLGWCQQQWS